MRADASTCKPRPRKGARLTFQQEDSRRRSLEVARQKAADLMGPFSRLHDVPPACRSRDSGARCRLGEDYGCMHWDLITVLYCQPCREAGELRGLGVGLRYALAFDILVLESRKFRQGRLIEHVNMALAEF